MGDKSGLIPKFSELGQGSEATVTVPSLLDICTFELCDVLSASGPRACLPAKRRITPQDSAERRVEPRRVESFPVEYKSSASAVLPMAVWSPLSAPTRAVSANSSPQPAESLQDTRPPALSLGQSATDPASPGSQSRSLSLRSALPTLLQSLAGAFRGPGLQRRASDALEPEDVSDSESVPCDVNLPEILVQRVFDCLVDRGQLTARLSRLFTNTFLPHFTLPSSFTKRMCVNDAWLDELFASSHKLRDQRLRETYQLMELRVRERRCLELGLRLPGGPNSGLAPQHVSRICQALVAFEIPGCADRICDHSLAPLVDCRSLTRLNLAGILPMFDVVLSQRLHCSPRLYSHQRSSAVLFAS